MHSCGSAGRAAGNLFPFTKIKNIHRATKAVERLYFCAAALIYDPWRTHETFKEQRVHIYRSFSRNSQETFVLRNEFIHRERKKRLLEMVTFVQFPPRSWRVGDVSWLFVNNTKQPHTLCSMHLASSSSAFPPLIINRDVQIMHFLLVLHFSMIG